MNQFIENLQSLFQTPFSIEQSFSGTEKAEHKAENEDSYTSWFDQKYGVFCIADGIGGSAGGKQASLKIVNSIVHECELFAQNFNRFNIRDSIEIAIKEVNNEIHSNDIYGMGSTVAILLMEPSVGSAQIIHAGDSRIYRFRRNTLKRMTRDHSMAAQLGYSDERKVPSIIKGRLTNAVGIKEELKLNRTSSSVRKDDIYLLCSDGLNKHFTDDEITAVIKGCDDKNVEFIGDTMIQIDKDQGAKDDVSIMLVKVANTPAGPLKLYVMLSLIIMILVLAISVLLTDKTPSESKTMHIAETVEKSNVPPITQKDSVVEISDIEPKTQPDDMKVEVAIEPDTNPPSTELVKNIVSDVEVIPTTSESVNVPVVQSAFTIDILENWETFGHGVLQSNSDSSAGEVQIDISWPQSNWGVGLKITLDESIPYLEPPTINIDIKDTHGSGTRVYAGVSSLDDANLELKRHKSKEVISTWKTVSFPIADMERTFPEATSRTFINADKRKIRIIKLLFTNPMGSIHYEKLAIRNLRITY